MTSAPFRPTEFALAFASESSRLARVPLSYRRAPTTILTDRGQMYTPPGEGGQGQGWGRGLVACSISARANLRQLWNGLST